MPHHFCIPQVTVPNRCALFPALDPCAYQHPWTNRAPVAASLLVQPGTAIVTQRCGFAPEVTLTPASITPSLPACYRPVAACGNFGGAFMGAPGLNTQLGLGGGPGLNTQLALGGGPGLNTQLAMAGAGGACGACGPCAGGIPPMNPNANQFMCPLPPRPIAWVQNNVCAQFC
jgi:hypothetical protein